MRKNMLWIWMLFLVCSTSSLDAQSVDPHALYEQHCSTCHEPHAGDFTIARLEILNDALVVFDSGELLSGFLNTGHGGLSPSEVDVMIGFLSEIWRSGRLFDIKCGICHARAKELARLNLIIEDGELMGRYTGRDISEFLKDHGRLEPSEVPVIMQMFERQLESKPPIWP